MVKAASFLVALAIWLCSIPAVFAETALADGIAFYKAGQYSRARDYFEYIVKKEPNCWQAHYELANTYMRMNEPQLAKGHYDAALLATTDTKVARLCEQLIAYIDHASGTKPYANATKTVAVPVKQPEPTAENPHPTVEFKHRINIVPPQFDHQRVGEATIMTVTGVVDNLPPHIYEILNNGGATVNISPNITDKWPDMLKGKMDADSLHLAQDCARCYGRDVYIYERKLIEGTNKLGDEVFDSTSVTNVLKHELGHAVDDCSGVYSKTADVLAMYERDVNAMSEEMRHRLWYYTKPGFTGCKEALAELFAGMLGSTGKDTQEVRESFPECRRWMLDKLKL